MIISASRRTDIPAFYSEWFMNQEIALNHYNAHNPESTALIGSPEPSKKGTSPIERPLI